MKAVVFDFDGTIADTIPICIEAFKKTFREHLGKDLSEDEIYNHFGPTEEGIFKNLMEDRWEQGFKTYLTHYEKLHDANVQIEEGLLDLFSDLKEHGVRIGIVSGKGAGSMAISLAHLGIESTFEKVITGSEKGAYKQDHLKALLEEWRIKPSEAVYVGDTSYDMEVAKAVGMIALGAAWTPKARVLELMNEKPTAIFTKGRLLRNFLNEMVLKQKQAEQKNLAMYFIVFLIFFSVLLFMIQK